jgi:hypothetical protein
MRQIWITVTVAMGRRHGLRLDRQRHRRPQSNAASEYWVDHQLNLDARRVAAGNRQVNQRSTSPVA